MKYHKRFTKFHKRGLAETKEFFDSKPWRGSDAERSIKFAYWVKGMSRAYDVPTPALRFLPAAECGGSGCYLPLEKEIRLPKFSVVTLFHEYRHHLQHNGAPKAFADLEKDARAWSLSLFFAFKPRLFAKSVNSGKIMYVKPEDLEE